MMDDAVAREDRRGKGEVYYAVFFPTENINNHRK